MLCCLFIFLWWHTVPVEGMHTGYKAGPPESADRTLSASCFQHIAVMNGHVSSCCPLCCGGPSMSCALDASQGRHRVQTEHCYFQHIAVLNRLVPCICVVVFSVVMRTRRAPSPPKACTVGMLFRHRCCAEAQLHKTPYSWGQQHIIPVTSVLISEGVCVCTCAVL